MGLRLISTSHNFFYNEHSCERKGRTYIAQSREIKIRCVLMGWDNEDEA